MNGIHAVVLATGNDTRGAEASARVVMDTTEVSQHGNMIKTVAN